MTGLSLTGDAILAPALGVRRDGETNARSTRGLLITILGELVRPANGVVWTQTILDALTLFNVEPKTARQAIARLGDQGWLTAERVGRRTRWHLTDYAQALLGSGAERIYSFGSTDTEWDRRWLLLLVTVPESQRNLRYRLGVGLGWAGFGALGQGNWLSPWSDREEEAVKLLAELGLGEATLFRAEIGPVGDGAALASRAWDLDGIRNHYEGFIAAANGGRRSASPGPDAVATLIELVHRWRRFPLIDPDLPRTLLPNDWPAARAAKLFSSHRDQLRGPAETWWRNLEATYEP